MLQYGLLDAAPDATFVDATRGSALREKRTRT